MAPDTFQDRDTIHIIHHHSVAEDASDAQATPSDQSFPSLSPSGDEDGEQEREHVQTGYDNDHEEEELQPDTSRPLLSLHLETISLHLFHLIDTHSFTLPTWTPFLAPSFRAYPNPPYPPLNLTISELLSYMSWLGAKYPAWSSRCTDLTSYLLTEKTGEVFLNIASQGIPTKEIMSRSVAVIKFKELKVGGWKCVGFTSIQAGPGMGQMEF